MKNNQSNNSTNESAVEILIDPKRIKEAKESIKAVAQQVLQKKRLRKGLRL